MFRVMCLSLIATATGLAAASQPSETPPEPERAALFRFWQNLAFASGDAVHGAEMQESALRAEIRQHELEVRARELRERRQFEAKFNQLVSAVEHFGKQYNEGKGHVWPRREAEELRKAISEVQRLEGWRRDDAKTKSAPPSQEPSVASAR